MSSRRWQKAAQELIHRKARPDQLKSLLEDQEVLNSGDAGLDVCLQIYLRLQSQIEWSIRYARSDKERKAYEWLLAGWQEGYEIIGAKWLKKFPPRENRRVEL